MKFNDENLVFVRMELNTRLGDKIKVRARLNSSDQVIFDRPSEHPLDDSETMFVRVGLIEYASLTPRQVLPDYLLTGDQWRTLEADDHVDNFVRMLVKGVGVPEAYAQCTHDGVIHSDKLFPFCESYVKDCADLDRAEKEHNHYNKANKCSNQGRFPVVGFFHNINSGDRIGEAVIRFYTPEMRLEHVAEKLDQNIEFRPVRQAFPDAILQRDKSYFQNPMYVDNYADVFVSRKGDEFQLFIADRQTSSHSTLEAGQAAASLRYRAEWTPKSLDAQPSYTDVTALKLAICKGEISDAEWVMQFAPQDALDRDTFIEVVDPAMKLFKWEELPNSTRLYWPEKADLPFSKQDFMDVFSEEHPGHDNAMVSRRAYELFRATEWRQEHPKTLIEESSENPSQLFSGCEVALYLASDAEKPWKTIYRSSEEMAKEFAKEMHEEQEYCAIDVRNFNGEILQRLTPEDEIAEKTAMR